MPAGSICYRRASSCATDLHNLRRQLKEVTPIYLKPIIPDIDKSHPVLVKHLSVEEPYATVCNL